MSTLWDLCEQEKVTHRRHIPCNKQQQQHAVQSHISKLHGSFLVFSSLRPVQRWRAQDPMWILISGERPLGSLPQGRVNQSQLKVFTDRSAFPRIWHLRCDSLSGLTSHPPAESLTQVRYSAALRAGTQCVNTSPPPHTVRPQFP